MAPCPLEIEADVRGLDPADPTASTRCAARSRSRRTAGQVESVALDPAGPAGLPGGVEAVLDADWVVLGPGLLVHLVMPHLLVPELRDALVETDARRRLVLNLRRSRARPTASRPSDHLEVLAEHAPDLQSTWCSPTRRRSRTSPTELRTWRRRLRRAARAWPTSRTAAPARSGASRRRARGSPRAARS